MLLLLLFLRSLYDRYIFIPDPVYTTSWRNEQGGHVLISNHITHFAPDDQQGKNKSNDHTMTRTVRQHEAGRINPFQKSPNVVWEVNRRDHSREPVLLFAPPRASHLIPALCNGAVRPRTSTLGCGCFFSPDGHGQRGGHDDTAEH
jgi:hypothetical protein